MGRKAAGNLAFGLLVDASSMEDLRRLQLAHEGMRLLLSSEVKQAEQLFRKSRCVQASGRTMCVYMCKTGKDS